MEIYYCWGRWGIPLLQGMHLHTNGMVFHGLVWGLMMQPFWGPRQVNRQDTESLFQRMGQWH